jgi:hypothetical protein
MQDKFCEFPTLKQAIQTGKMAARYLEAARIIGHGEFTKIIPHTTVHPKLPAVLNMNKILV